ncbi:hypothetical protein [Paraburkholderia sp. ZP32-5]|uniref:hypothetical protein n=1 Tax=Paraburkholderia sp. ZP32-5 TaxID=2883245 RepID=UPI001F3BB551|nr:hypothetical protein [Paraburkholderia sp. ZP32-5]
MPADINFRDKLNRLHAFSRMKLGIGIPTELKGRGYRWIDIESAYQDFVANQREFRVADYAAFRAILDLWSPQRVAWQGSQGVARPTAATTPGFGRSASISSHRAASGRAPLGTWQGGHPSEALQPTAMNVPETRNTRPVVAHEWTTHLAAGTQIDLQVRNMFVERPEVEAMFIRRASDLPHLERIEVGSGRLWTVVWSST